MTPINESVWFTSSHVHITETQQKPLQTADFDHASVKRNKTVLLKPLDTHETRETTPTEEHTEIRQSQQWDQNVPTLQKSGLTVNKSKHFTVYKVFSILYENLCFAC